MLDLHQRFRLPGEQAIWSPTNPLSAPREQEPCDDGGMRDAGTALIRGGTVIDGSGAPGVVADIRVRSGRIAEVGPGLRPDGETEIDAAGAFVSPGFVDAHTHYDPSLWWDPSCSEMAANGVTAVVIGNCSLSLAPLRASQRTELAGAFSFIEDLPEEAFRIGIPWSWEDWGDYRAAFDVGGSGVGVVGLVGHSVLRLFVMGADAWGTGGERRGARPDGGGARGSDHRRSTWPVHILRRCRQ